MVRELSKVHLIRHPSIGPRVTRIASFCSRPQEPDGVWMLSLVSTGGVWKAAPLATASTVLRQLPAGCPREPCIVPIPELHHQDWLTLTSMSVPKAEQTVVWWGPRGYSSLWGRRSGPLVPRGPEATGHQFQLSSDTRPQSALWLPRNSPQRTFQGSGKWLFFIIWHSLAQLCL